MRRKLPLGVLVILVLAVASLPASASSSQAGSSAGDEKKVEVIRLTAVTIQETELDLGEPGESLGDQLIFTEDLFRDGKKVGIDGGVATVVRFEPNVSLTLQFVATVELPKGEITVQGLHTFTEEDEPQKFAITGGTGRYKTAHGVLTVVQTETGARLTFRVIR